MWIVNLGNFSLKSHTGMAHEIAELYSEHYEINIDSMNLKFEPS